MAENFLTKKHGPLPTWGWGLCVVGSYFGYRWYQNYEASKAAAAATATTGGTTIPAGGSITSTTTGSYSSLAAWEAAAIQELIGQGMNGADALTGITNWLNGTCVTGSVYDELAQVIATTGLPPGYSGTTMPALAVCASATTPPPASTSPVSVPYTAPTESDAAMPSGTATDPLGSGLVPSGYTQMSATNLGSALAGEALGVIHTYTYSGGQTVTVIQPASGNATVIPQGQVTSTLRGLGLTQSQITQLEQQGALG